LNGVCWFVLPKCPLCGAKHCFLSDGADLNTKVREELAPCNPRKTIKIQYRGNSYEGKGMIMMLPVEIWR